MTYGRTEEFLSELEKVGGLFDIIRGIRGLGAAAKVAPKGLSFVPKANVDDLAKALAARLQKQTGAPAIKAIGYKAPPVMMPKKPGTMGFVPRTPKTYHLPEM